LEAGSENRNLLFTNPSPCDGTEITVDPELQMAAEKSEILRLIKKGSEEECTMCGS
jgi:hypothetical protein